MTGREQGWTVGSLAPKKRSCWTGHSLTLQPVTFQTLSEIMVYAVGKSHGLTQFLGGGLTSTMEPLQGHFYFLVR